MMSERSTSAGTWNVSLTTEHCFILPSDSNYDSEEECEEFVVWYNEEDDCATTTYLSDEHEEEQGGQVENEDEEEKCFTHSLYADRLPELVWSSESADRHPPPLNMNMQCRSSGADVYPGPCGTLPLNSDSGSLVSEILYVDEHLLSNIIPIPTMNFFLSSSSSFFPSSSAAWSMMEMKTDACLMLELKGCNVKASKAAFDDAAAFANKHRGRYDSAHHSLYHREWDDFQWTDPAIPVLTKMRKRTENHVLLDSSLPFAMPHIVLTKSPREDWSVAAGNYPPCPQDKKFGDRLTVTACMMPVINVPLPPSSSLEAALVEEDVSAAYDEEEEETDSASDSSEEEDELQTPKDEDEILAIEHNPFIDVSLAGPPPSKSSLPSSDAVPLCQSESYLESFGYDGCSGWSFEPDEDNELPPFDEWYLARLPCS